ncbi:receptor-type tyrosine-protein phosphatase H-like [Clavelina lepadiformis]|uniref:receptor-type tyrosine-protein phosphatase H-like n=1 Tax=Clavelina lepadiformis TaxID=159417 RepID=UPI004042E73D
MSPPAPTDITITSDSSSQLTVSWVHDTSTPNECIGDRCHIVNRYQVTYSDGATSNDAFADLRTGTKHTLPITGLTSNTAYSVNVFAMTSREGKYSDASETENADTVPLQVSQTRNSSNPAVSSITLQWTAVSGHSPSLRYNVEWNPSGATGSNISVAETAATIDGLTASTRYSFTVTAVNDGGSADPSESSMFSTLPNQTNLPSLTRSSTNSTTQINVEWNKPPGGDDIVDYVVDWWLSSFDGSMTSSGIVTGATTSSYTIEGLTPGETYDVTVKARNSAGAGQPSSSARHTTNPDFIKNLSVKRNSTQPDKLLVLSWETPSGTGDNITIKYQSLTEHTMNTTSVEFEISQTSLSVVPGNNYTVTVTVRSKGYESTPESIDTNSKPSEPSFVVDVFTNELQVNWTSPDGHYEGLAIYFNNTEIAVRDSGSYTLKDLKPYTDYGVEMYSWITNVTGSVERSRLSSATYKTLPGAPPQPIFNSSLSDNAESSTNTITFVLPPNTFSEENGPIQYYAVYLAFGDSPNPTPNVTNMRTCESLATGDECVTLWTDDQGNLVQGNVPQKTKRSVLTRQTGSIQFIIGDGSVTLSPWNHTYFNYPLQPNTGYRVAVAANTGNEEMTATEFYPTITTGDSGTIYVFIR